MSEGTGLTVLDHLFQGGGFVVRKSGFIEVHEEVTTEHLVSVIKSLHHLDEDTQKLRKILSISTGSLVLEHAARHKCSLSESVDVLDICRDFDVAKKTVLKWAKIVSVIPEAVLELPNLHIGHFDAATSFAAPADPIMLRRYCKERDSILQDISEDPHDKGKRYVEDQMRALKVKHGVQKCRQESISQVMKKLISGYRLLRLQRDIRLGILAKVGLTDPDLFAYIRSWEDELVIRKQIPDDITAAPISWLNKSENQ